MHLISKIFIAIIAIEHLYILWLEMFVWTSLGKKLFRTIPPDIFEKTKTLAANQGLYNGFLSAGLIWSLVIDNHLWSKSIFIKQGIPVLLALIFTILNAYI